MNAATARLGALIAALLPGIAAAAGGVPQPDICDRDCWDARPPSSTPSQMSSLNRAVIHHTAISANYDTTSIEESKAQVRAVQNYHMDVNGWSDIGYHFLADKLGNAFEGREGSIDSRPRGAHDGVNDASMGFSMMGYFHDPYDQEPTEAIRCAVYNLIAWKIPDPYDAFGAGSYGGMSQVGFLAGHRDVKSTACPGDLMYDAYIGLDFEGGEAREEIHGLIAGASGLMCDGGPLCCPGAPTLDSVRVTDGGIALKWSDVGDVQGYRIHVTVGDDVGGTQHTVDLPAGQTTWVDEDAAPGEVRGYAVSAVGTLTESIPSDTYAARMTSRPAQVLVVDGYDRWITQPENELGLGHGFAGAAGAAIPAGIAFETVDNAAVVGGRVALTAYEAVVWVLGEESTQDDTFSGLEQLLVESYLDQGGQLFVSGAEIGWDLVARGSAADQDFYRFTLRASYVADDAGQTVAYPQPGGIFDGLGPLDFSGGVMVVDYPDVIAPAEGSAAQLYYTSVAAGDAEDRIAGVAWDGTSRLVHLAFPLEALGDRDDRAAVMARALDFFEVVGEDGAADAALVGSLRVGVVGRARLHPTAQVSVVTGAGIPVEGATVSGSFSGGVSQAVSAVSGRAGVAVLAADPLRGAAPSFTFCVDNIEAAGLSFDAGEASCMTFEPAP